MENDADSTNMKSSLNLSIRQIGQGSGACAITSLVLGSILTASVWGQDLIPMRTGNQWTFTSAYSTAPLSLSITKMLQLGPKSVALVDFNNPWMRHTLLLSEDSTGVMVEGFSVSGVTHWFTEPSPYFQTKVPVGTSWVTPFGTMSLEQTHVTVGSYQGCLRYRMRNPDGTTTVWVLKPGFGYVQFGEGPAAFIVSQSTALAPTDFTAAVKLAGPCPLLGVASMPTAASTTPAMRQSAFEEAAAGGSRWVNVNATWRELEPLPGKYNLTRITDELRLARQAAQRAVLTIKVTETTVTGLPSDLAMRAMNDATVVARFELLVDRLAALIKDTNVGWMNIGYEVDTFLFLNPGQITPFNTLFQKGKSRVKRHRSTIPVGMVFSFDTTRISDEMFNAVKKGADIISFNYYGLGPGFTHRSASAPLSDIPLMLLLAEGKPVLLTELGYSTGGVNGSAARQQEFLANAFSALRGTSGRVAGASVWAMRELPLSIANAVSAELGLAQDSNFMSFLRTAGLATETGTHKLAWDSFVMAASQYQMPSTCTIP